MAKPRLNIDISSKSLILKGKGCGGGKRMRTVARMDLKPGMTLGADVTVQGSVLFPAGTVLTQNNINRLKVYSIIVATVMEESDFASTHYEKLRYSRNFKAFEQ